MNVKELLVRTCIPLLREIPPGERKTMWTRLETGLQIGAMMAPDYDQFVELLCSRLQVNQVTKRTALRVFSDPVSNEDYQSLSEYCRRSRKAAVATVMIEWDIQKEQANAE